MIQTFTDLVGTSAVPAHAYDIDELTELTPALDTAIAAHDMGSQASEKLNSVAFSGCWVGVGCGP